MTRSNEPPVHAATECVHHPEVSHEGYKSLGVPTYRASTIVYPDGASFMARGERGFDGYTYGLHGTPTTRTLEAQITRLNAGVRTVLVPSGQAAASLVFMSVLKPGDRVLIPDHVYGPVRALARDFFAARGIRHTVYDPLIGGGIADLIDDATRLVWVESPGSNTMEVQDLPAIAAAARARGVLVGVDNTWATPLILKPLAHGAHFACEALTKYVGGHGDLLLGAVTAGDVGHWRELKETLKVLGIGVSPDECQLALRGFETMALRIAHAGRVSTEFAHRLAGHPLVARVLHPALPSCPGHEVWARDMQASSGVFSIVLEAVGDERLERALSALRVFAIGASWGGTRSLIAPTDPRPDRTVTPWTAAGPLVRLSIGIEHPDDLWRDLERFLDVAAGVA